MEGNNNQQGLYNVQQELEEGSSFDFKIIYTTLILNWQWFVLSLIICLSAAAIMLRYTTPMYQSYAKLLIKDDDNNGGRRGGRSTIANSSTLGIMTNSEGIDNEMEILKSTALATEAVKQLKLYTVYTLEGRIKDHLLYKNQPVNVDLDAAHIETLKMPISLVIDKDENGKLHVTGTYTYVPEDPDKPSKTYAINRTFDVLPARIITSVGIITFTTNTLSPMPDDRNELVTIYPPKMIAGKYSGALTVDQLSKNTSIASLTLTDEMPQRANDYLKQLVFSYNMQANEDKNEIAMRTEQFINSRLEKINTELGATEGSLEATKRQYKIVNPEATGALGYTNTDQFTQKLADMDMQIELLRSLQQYMNEPSNKYQTLPSNVGLNDAAASTLINDYNKIVMERNRLLRSANENSPTITPLTAQLDDLSSSIRRAMTQVQRNAQIQRNSILQEYNRYSSMIYSSPEQERVLNQIGRQQEVKSGLYLMLLQKREENSISLAATADKGKLIDDPVSFGQISPKKSIILLIALVIGLAIPSIVLFLINFFRYKIEGHEDVARLTTLPIIGDVAIASETAKTKADIVVHENQNNVMEEVFRSIRSNIQFMLKEDQKVIMSTSTTPGEGKTFTAANLAVSFALLGKKVLVMGLDIRKPRLTNLFELKDKNIGITNLLVHDNPTHEDICANILNSGVNRNLDIMPAGPIPPNPAELVSRESLDNIFAALRKEYDYIIVDTAPVGLVTDTLMIARVADLTVYMCRADYTPKSSFEFINSLSAQKKLPQVSIVINGIDMSKKKYGYYYGYGKYGKYGRYGKSGSYGSKYGGNYGGNYGLNYTSYGAYGNYADSNYGNKKDDSIKRK